MNRIFILLVWVPIMALSSCMDRHSPAPLAPGEVRSRLDDSATQILHQALGHYMELKESLVLDQGPAASMAAKDLGGAMLPLKARISTYEKREENEDYLLSIDTLIEANQHILVQETEELEWKRYYFAQVSEVFHRLLLMSEWEGPTIYLQYCPMAFNDHGAYWLSQETEIRNPYFGRLLMECGEILEQIP